MQPFAVNGSLGGHSAAILLDGSRARSTIATRFAISNLIGRTLVREGDCAHFTSTGPVVVPTVSGWYQSTFRMDVDYLRQFDVILGRDWIEDSGSSFLNGFVLDPHNETALRSGHLWVASPTASGRATSSSASSSRSRGESATSSMGSVAVGSPTFQHTIGDAMPGTSSTAPQQSSSSYLTSSFAPLHPIPSPPVYSSAPFVTSLTNDSPPVVPRSARSDVLLSAGVGYAISMLFPRNARLSLFGLDDRLMCATAATHGVPRSDPVHMRRVLVAHLLDGSCGSHASGDKPTGCHQVSGSFESAVTLRQNVRHHLADAVAIQPLSSIRIICEHLFELSAGCSSAHDERSTMLNAMNRWYDRVDSRADLLSDYPSVDVFLDDIEKMDVPNVLRFASQHGIQTDSTPVQHIRVLLTQHVVTGVCARRLHGECGPACSNIEELYLRDDDTSWKMLALQINLLTSVVDKANTTTLRRLLESHKIPHSRSTATGRMRRLLRKHIASLKKAKHVLRLGSDRREQQREQAQASDFHRDDVRSRWPQLVPDSLKERLVHMFREETSSAHLRTFTCATCTEAVLLKDENVVSIDALPLDLLQWTPSSCPSLLHDSADPRLRGLALHPSGIGTDVGTNGEPVISICKDCLKDLNNGRTPALSLANGTYLGAVPPELQDLTSVEESMIARARSKCMIIHLKQDSQQNSSTWFKRAITGRNDF